MPRRTSEFVDPQLDVLDRPFRIDPHRALAFDAGGEVGLDRRRPLPLGMGIALLAERLSGGVVRPEQAKQVSVGGAETLETSLTSDGVFGLSIGPKQPWQPRWYDGQIAPHPA